MSYILDALKKLETEKETKARGAGMINIAGELFKNGPAPPKAPRNWPLILGLALLASLLTFGATFMLLHEGKGKRHAVSVPPAPPGPATSAPPSPYPYPVPKPPAATASRHVAPHPAPAPKAGKAPSAPRQSQVVRPVQPAPAPAAGESVPAEPARPAVSLLSPLPPISRCRVSPGRIIALRPGWW